MLRRGIVSVLFVLLGLAWGGTAQAATTIAVNTTADNAPSGGECSGVANDCSLRQAVDKAASGDTVSIPASADHYLLTSGHIDIEKDLTITGAGAQNAIVDATGGSAHRIFLIGNTSSHVVAISGVTLTGGHPAATGGAIDLERGSLTISDTAIRGNTTSSSSEGGGIYQDGGTLSVLRSEISGNSASSHGGGVDLDSGDSTFTNTTIAGNHTTAQGGGIDRDTAGTVKLTNVTLVGNISDEVSDNSGGISDDSKPTIQAVNTIIAFNTVAGVRHDCESTEASLGHNLDSDSTCFTQSTDLHAADPQLGALAFNGGPTQTMALLMGSPAINAGDNSACPATDQRGITRPQLGACDIGAYEYAPGAAAASVPPCSSTGNIVVTVAPPQGGAAVAVRYRLDGGAEQRQAVSSADQATLSVAQGRHALEYWAESQGGDQELTHHTATVVVDKIKPHVAILSDQRRVTYRRRQYASVTITAYDSGAGLTANPSRRRKKISTSGLGRHSVSATAIDRCGNRTTGTYRYRVVAAASRGVHRAHRGPRFTG